MTVKKVIVCTDVEGVAGVVDFESQAYGNGKYYEQAKLLLTAEVNAAVEGMLEAGVEEIIVVDGHGAGGIHYESLHPEAKLLHGRIMSWKSTFKKVASDCDAGIMIGQHSMAGVPQGNLNHTQNDATIEYYKLNGKFIGEIAQWSLFCGAHGIPMIFLSGDDTACHEVQELIPNITTAAVKQGISRLAAVSLSPAKVHALIKAAITKAIQKQNSDPIAPLIWEGPFVLEKRFLFTETAEAAANSANYKQINAKTVQIKADNIEDIIYA
ncbi:MAG: M55 family metallopeptidase [Sedimentisphaerales bacterium]|nr:M55 family metallopeptidase [Sedimentisphaerales bacterium]